MGYSPLLIGDLKAEKPLIQGGMGIGISLSGLAGAVAKEGGVGIISAAQIGFREPDFMENALAANLRAIASELKKAREIASEGIIGFNIMVATKDYESHVRTAAAAGADLIVSGAGLPVDLPAYLEASPEADGRTPKIAPIVSSEKSARIILKYWDKKYHRTADLVVIEGPEAGGHLGFEREQLAAYCGGGASTSENSVLPAANYDDEIKKIMQVVKNYEEKYGRPIPVAIGGGISNAAKAAHAFELGADAIQAATRFVTTEECDADIRYKEAYLAARKEDIQIVKSPVGMPGRAIMNPFMKSVMAGNTYPPRRCLACMKGCKASDTPYCITEALIHAARGEMEQALLFCGADAWKANRIETVKTVMDELLGP